MQKLLSTCLPGAALLAIPMAASAADLGQPRPVQPAYVEEPQGFLWTGLYGGISGGWGWGQSSQNYERAGDHGLDSTDPSGGFGALTLGYNYQLTNGLLIGAEGDLGLMDLSADDKEVYDGHIYKTRFGPLWSTVRGRLGFAFDRTLIYGTAGVAFMDLDEISIGNTPGETAINEDFKSGWVVGGGLEHAFSPRMTAKIEYLHTDFGTFHGLSDNRENFTFDTKADLVRAGINYKF